MIRLSALPLSALALSATLAAQEHDLRLTARPGTSVWIAHSSMQAQEIDMGGQKMEAANAMNIALSFAVKEVSEEGDTVVEAKLERVHGRFRIPMMGDHDFDSLDAKPGDAEEAPPEDDLGGFGMPDFGAIGRAAAGMAGTTLVARLDAYGKVKSIGGVEAAVERMTKRAGRTGAQMLMPHFNGTAFENLVEAAFGERPAKPTEVGATWPRTHKEGDSRPTENKVTMTLAKVGDESFEVTGTGTITKPEPKPRAEGAEENEEEAMRRELEEQMKIENGRVSGRAVVSRTDGFVIESKTEMSMDMKMPNPLGGEMSVTQRGEIVTKRTTKEAAMKRADSGGK